MKFTIHHLPFTIRSPLFTYRERQLYNVWKKANGKRIASLLFLVIPSIFYFSHQALAANPTSIPTPSGITLSPAVVQTAVQEGEAEHKLEFKVTNNKKVEQTISITTADFNTLDESGGLVFVGTNPSKLQKKYGLATWVTLPTSNITLKPRETSTITASVVNQASLASGGHYGALLLGLADDSGKARGNNKVALHPIASSLLFINKVGGDTHKLKLTDVYSSHNIFNLPKAVTLRFYNDGNTHLIPRGTVSVTDPHGKLISKGVINENSAIILPETYRRYSVPLNDISTAALPGKYKITVDFRFDGIDQFRTYQTSQLLLTSTLVLLIVAIIIFFGLVTALFYTKNRKIRLAFSQLLKRFKIRK
jgi:hypothetical protein